MNRIAAAPYISPTPHTAHQMRNIGSGNHPDAPLQYRAEIHLDGWIAPFPATCRATSHEDAMRIFQSATFYANETPGRAVPFTVRNVRIL